jgi:hypothetical protein
MATLLLTLCEKHNKKHLIPMAIGTGLFIDAMLIKLLFSFL